LARAAISEGEAIVIGDGKGVWDNGTITAESLSQTHADLLF
jgi:hypothetical protein